MSAHDGLMPALTDPKDIAEALVRVAELSREAATILRGLDMDAAMTWAAKYERNAIVAEAQAAALTRGGAA